MRARLVSFLAVVGALVVACGDNLAPPGFIEDASPQSDGPADVDALPPDAPPADAPAMDAMTADASSMDAMNADAPPLGFECIGQPIPPAEGPTVTINGVTVTIMGGGQVALGNVALSAFSAGTTTNPLATGTSASDGTYSLTAPTVNMQPVDAYIRATRAGLLPSFLYPPTPVFQTVLDGATTILLDRATVDLAALIANASQPLGRGLVILIVTDCDGNPLAGATVTSNPPAGAVRYFRAGLPNQSATNTDTDGFAILFNVPPGPVTVDASEAGGASLREHTLDVVADAVTSTIIQP